MSLLRRLEMLEDAMQRQSGDTGYKLVMVEDGEMPEEAVTRAGFTNWPADRIILISFVEADQKLS
jgi:hypothetical protein